MLPSVSNSQSCQPGEMSSWTSRGRPSGGPFIFDLKVPVKSVRILELGQEATAAGITLTLDRVIDSSGRPQAVLCYEAPDDGYHWTLYGGKGTYLGGWGSSGSIQTVPPAGCQKLELKGPLQGRTILEVAAIDGSPKCLADDPKAEEECYNRIGERQIRGSWTFAFDTSSR